METKLYDVIVIGGGINGAGIAADAAGRGLSVGLMEMNDLASATSSASSKLIHGGLRYLEHYEFRLVREALAEREVILAMAPHIVSPLRFCLPHCPHLRPAIMIRAGLFLYDNLATLISLKRSSGVCFGRNSVLKPQYRRGFEYSDAWVDDARLVTLNAKMAEEQGADILTRTKCIAAQRNGDHWQVSCLDMLTGQSFTLRCKALVNAAGPWVSSFFDDALAEKSPRGICLIKGSHIIVPKMHNEKRAYILQNKDNRIIFVIPFQDDFSLIGTTDLEYDGDPSKVEISYDEQQYLCDIANEFFNTQISIDDVVKTYSGVRPLCDDESSSPQAITRDYTVDVYDENGKLPLLTIFGGKLTTYRKLAQAAMHKLTPYFSNVDGDWTEKSKLPGGDFNCSIELLIESIQQKFTWLPTNNAKRYAKTYGTRSFAMLNDCVKLTDLGTHFGAGLYSLEVDYLIEHEWAYSLEDIIWRRTKLELYLNETEKQILATHIDMRLSTLLPQRFPRLAKVHNINL